MKKRYACVLLASREAVEPFAEACFRLSPQIAIREFEAVFIEVGASYLLYSESSIEARLQMLAQRLLRGSVKITFADTVGDALAAARYPEYARTKMLSALPLSALSDFVSPFVQEKDIEKRIKKVETSLGALGIHDLGGFASLPRSGLASRFGKPSLEWMAKIWGEIHSPWVGFHPLPRIIEKEEIKNPESHGICADLESSLFILRGILDRVMARLRGRGERLLSFRVSMKPNQRIWNLDLTLPQGSVAGVIPILRDRLSFDLQRNPFQCPVESIEVEVLESVPGQVLQNHFFSKAQEEQELWSGLIARLSQKLGKNQVFTALPVSRYLPEKSFCREAPQEDTGVSSVVYQPPWEGVERPLRLLRNPELLEKVGQQLKGRDGRCWQIRQAQGPERISVEWWKNSRFEPQQRDYYQLLTDSGQKLWIFETPDASVYLHGYFD